MDIIRKLKINHRLQLSFLIFIMFSIMMGAIGSINIQQINRSANVILDKDFNMQLYLQRIHTAFQDVRINLRSIALYSNVQTTDDMEGIIYIVQDKYMDMADDVINLMSLINRYTDTDPRHQQEVTKIGQIERFIEEDYRAVVNDFIRAARADVSMVQLNHILIKGQNVSDELEKLINSLYQDSLDYIEIAKREVNANTNSTIQWMIIINVVVALASVILGSGISRSISIPIQKLMAGANKLTQGDLDAALEEQHMDEIGLLNQDFNRLSQTLKELIRQMEAMAKSFNAGDLDAFIDETHFQGAYGDVAKGINGMIRAIVADVLETIGCLTEFGKGNFDADIPKYSGKKAVLNESVDNIRRNLLDVTGEINDLVTMATEGRLDERVPSDAYSGGWATIINSLNRLLDTVATPMNEAAETLIALSRGDLSAHMTGSYKGHFNLMKNSLNNSMDFIAAYISEINVVLAGLVEHKDFNNGIQRDFIGDFQRIKTSINEIITSFNDILSSINVASEMVAQGAGVIRQSSGDLKHGCDDQSAMVEALNCKLKQMDNLIQANAISANQANNYALLADQCAQSASQDMNGMLAAMDKITESSKNISNVIKVIQDIAFQTNILAINASIEAAQAGVHGKGFSVVAEEVRTLARRSQAATTQTTQIISSMQHTVEDGAQMSRQTAQALHGIVEQVTEIAEIIRSIHQSSRQQAGEIISITEGLTAIEAVTQQTLQFSNDTLGLAEKLADSSKNLKIMVDAFTLIQ